MPGAVVSVRAHDAPPTGQPGIRMVYTPQTWVCPVSSAPLCHEMLRVCALLLAAVAAAADFRVKFEVEVPSGAKEFTVLVHEDWAPIGAARFRELVEAKFYDNTRCVVGVGVAP